jgi:hypothetical protein
MLYMVRTGVFLGWFKGVCILLHLSAALVTNSIGLTTLALRDTPGLVGVGGALLAVIANALLMRPTAAEVAVASLNRRGRHGGLPKPAPTVGEWLIASLIGFAFSGLAIEYFALAR